MADMGTNGNRKHNSPFDPTERDLEDLARRYIDAETAQLNGIYRVDDQGGAEIIGRRFGSDGRRYCGLVIPNYRVGIFNPRSYRLRRDYPDLEPRTDGPGHKEKGKYLWAAGSRSQFYYPFGNKREHLADTNIPAYFIEGEFKAIALKRILTEAGCEALVIGLYGAHNWKGTTGKTANASGRREDIHGPVNDFEDVEWKGREVVICRDANFRTNPQVASGMRDLAGLSSRLGSVVFYADTPDLEGINGLDDLAGLHGPDAVLDVLSAAYLAIKPPIKPETKEERESKKEALRQMVREQATKEDDYTQTRRRATSADFAAVSTMCAELEWKDKARVGLQALVALSGGRRLFQWRYGELYPFLRRFDPELFKDADDREIDQQTRKKVPSKKAKKALSKINGMVRGYVDAIDSDQDRCGIKLADTKRGTKHFDDSGNEVFEPSETTLHILGYLEEIDALAKANPSYTRASGTIRREEARLIVSRLAKYTPVKKPSLSPQKEIEMGMKRAAGNLKSVIEQMRQQDYEDWAIRHDLKKYLPGEFFEIMGLVEIQGDTPLESYIVDSETTYRDENVDDLH
jgi:hypothetical protein